MQKKIKSFLHVISNGSWIPEQESGVQLQGKLHFLNFQKKLKFFRYWDFQFEIVPDWEIKMDSFIKEIIEMKNV